MAYQVEIRKLREQHGLSQRKVAERIHVTPGAVAQWELGLQRKTCWPWLICFAVRWMPSLAGNPLAAPPPNTILPQKGGSSHVGRMSEHL